MAPDAVRHPARARRGPDGARGSARHRAGNALRGERQTVATWPTRLGTLPIGYSNSILVPRPGQTVRVEGRDAPVLSVLLEHTVVDLSEVGSTQAGAFVCLLAGEPSTGPTLAEVTAHQGRSSLEVVVSLTGRATYEYRDEGPPRPRRTA